MGTPVDLPQSGLGFRNQLRIGYKILRELASGFRRVHGEEPSKPSKPSVFTFAGFFRRKVRFFLEPSKPSKPSNPPVRYRQFLKRARELPWGTVKTVSFFQKGPPIGSKEHLLTPRLLTPRLAHPDLCVCAVPLRAVHPHGLPSAAHDRLGWHCQRHPPRQTSGQNLVTHCAHCG